MLEWCKKAVNIFLIVIFCYLLFPKEAHAYVDPGTGSLIIQMLIGALVGGLVVLKIFWARVKGFFQSVFSSSKKHK